MKIPLPLLASLVVGFYFAPIASLDGPCNEFKRTSSHLSVCRVVYFILYVYIYVCMYVCMYV